MRRKTGEQIDIVDTFLPKKIAEINKQIDQFIHDFINGESNKVIQMNENIIESTHKLNLIIHNIRFLFKKILVYYKFEVDFCFSTTKFLLLQIFTYKFVQSIVDFVSYHPSSLLILLQLHKVRFHFNVCNTLLAKFRSMLFYYMRFSKCFVEM